MIVDPEVSSGSSGFSSREQRGWYFYDFAASAFLTATVTLFLGPYLTALAKAAADIHGYVHPFGLPIDARAYWGYLIALSVLTQVVCLPVIGAFADASGAKRQLLALFAYIGAFSAMAMFFVQGRAYLAGGALFLIANLAFGSSIVVYNSFLPDIAGERDRDRVSTRGWGTGYIGGGLLLALNLYLFHNASSFGLSEAQAVRISLCSAGTWWAVFTVIPLATLRNRPAASKSTAAGIRKVFVTLGELRRYPQTLLFLLAYLLYMDAIQAVITLTTQFGSDELKIPIGTLTLMILMVQFVGFFGALSFGWIARFTGAKRAVLGALVLWIAALVAIYGWVRTTAQFFVVAAVVAMILGGSQALSRSLFSLMIPKSREAEYFGVYEISDRGTSWLCPLLFALALQFTHSYRLAILSLVMFFVAGFLVLARVNVRRAVLESGNEAA